MVQSSQMKVIFLGALITLVPSFSACSSSECGAGTVKQGDTCVAAPSNNAPTFGGIVEAKAASATSVQLSWNDATDAKTPANKMLYRIFIATSSGAFSKIPQATTLGGEKTKVITNLTPGATYFFMVHAVNEAGVESANTDEKSVTLSQPDNAAPTFSGIKNITVSGNNVTLTWDPATDNQTPASEMNYDVWELSSNNCNSLGSPTSVKGVTTHTLNGVNLSGDKYFLVRARDAAGNRDSNCTAKPASSKVDFANIVNNIFVGTNGKCATSGCHIGSDAPNGLDLSTVDKAFSNLVDKVTQGPYAPNYLPLDKLPSPNKCTVPYDNGKLIRVIPFCPEGSFLYQKITGTHKQKTSGDPLNLQMPNPATGVTLSPEEKDQIGKWIEEGAKKTP